MKLRLNLLLLALALPGLAGGEPLDQPARVARLSYVEGEVRLQGANDSAATTLPDRPLVARDRLVTGHGGLAELALGTATIRLDQQSELTLVDLDATTIRIELATGSASVYLNELLEDESFEILTPNTAITLDGPGEYRADLSANRSTALTVRSGVATVATASGPVRVAAGQRVQFEGRDALASLMAPLPADAFDEWVLERELRLAEAAPTYTPYEGNAYEELDQYGEWYEEPRYGRVWMPSYAYGGYDPFRYGHWQRYGLGWSWVNTMPWGYQTYYSGRWAYLHDRNRWCWVPSRHDHWRRDERDTRPYRMPYEDERRADNWRDRPGDVNPRRDVDERAPVAESPRAPIRFEGGRRQPTFQGENRGGKTPARAAPAPRPSAPASQAEAPTTIRPTRTADTRSPVESRPAPTVKGTLTRTEEP